MNAREAAKFAYKFVLRKRQSGGMRTTVRSCWPTRASLRFADSIAAVVAIVILTTPTSAGTVVQGVGASLVGASSVNQMNVSVSSLTPLILREPNGDEAFSSGGLNGPSGTATLSVHACSGPGNGPYDSGSASGGVNLNFGDTYQVISGTLPIGAPVFISLLANGARRETTTLDVDDGSANTGNVAYGFGDASIYFQTPSATYSFSGSFNHRINLVDGDTMAHTGLFDGQDSQQLKTVVGGKLESSVVSALVGDYITVGVSAGVLSQSAASTGALADTDAQMVLNWGVHPFDSAVQIINVTYPGDTVPDNSDFTLDQVIAGLPPRPPTTDVPEPGKMILLGEAIFAGLGVPCCRRRYVK